MPRRIIVETVAISGADSLGTTLYEKPTVIGVVQARALAGYRTIGKQYGESLRLCGDGSCLGGWFTKAKSS